MRVGRYALVALLAAGVAAGWWLSRPADWGDPRKVGAALRSATGARTRVAWVQDIGRGNDTYAARDTLRLMGMDSDDGLGPRVILATRGNYAKPLIVPSGDRVVFSNRLEKKVYAVNWDGSGLRAVCDGVGLDVWTDPAGGPVWVYVAQDQQPSKFVADSKYATVRRYQLDAPEVNELVWNKTLVGIDSFQLSADGRRAGFLFPWPEAGVAELPNGNWTKYAEGCWTALAPDDSYRMWVFDGPHRNLTLFDSGPETGHLINISGAPGVNGVEVYHPRWSNHVRVMAMTGPYPAEGGGNNVHRGGKEVEIHIGRFDPDLKSVEQWVQVTHNRRADFYPDVWVEPGGTLPVTLVSGATTRPTDGAFSAWPGSHGRLLFVWEDASKTNRVSDGAVERACKVEPKGRARYARHHVMDLVGSGSFLAQGADDALAALKAVGHFSIEATLYPSASPSAPANIIWLGGDALADLRLVQEGDRLVALLKTTASGDPTRLDLGLVHATQPNHVLLTYRSGELRCYRDGAPVATPPVSGHLSNWSSATLAFGADPAGGAAWSGRLEGVALHARFVDAGEAQTRYQTYASRIAARKPIDRIVVKAKLVEASAIPAPDQIAPYRRCLVANEYEIESVISGKLEAKRVLAAHWAILDAQTLPEAARKKGETYTLVLESFEEHAQLKGERLAQDSENFELQLFYDLGSVQGTTK